MRPATVGRIFLQHTFPGENIQDNTLHDLEIVISQQIAMRSHLHQTIPDVLFVTLADTDDLGPMIPRQ